MSPLVLAQQGGGQLDLGRCEPRGADQAAAEMLGRVRQLAGIPVAHLHQSFHEMSEGLG